jgi:hypothetical protein
MVTWIAMNIGCPEVANLAYIEGDVPVLSLDHFPFTCTSCMKNPIILYLWSQGDLVT